MARSWKAPRLLLAVLVALVAFTYQKKKSFIGLYEMSAVDSYVKEILQYVTNTYNRDNEDLYYFRILRVLKIVGQITDHMEYHINVEMRRTTCLKPEKDNCEIQEGELYKQIQCYFLVFAIPWFERYKILKTNCSNT